MMTGDDTTRDALEGVEEQCEKSLRLSILSDLLEEPFSNLEALEGRHPQLVVGGVKVEWIAGIENVSKKSLQCTVLSCVSVRATNVRDYEMKRWRDDLAEERLMRGSSMRISACEFFFALPKRTTRSDKSKMPKSAVGPMPTKRAHGLPFPSSAIVKRVEGQRDL